jgi:hypothetical protein
MRLPSLTPLLLLLLPTWILPATGQTQTVVLAPAADNTLYDANLPNISNGAGQHLFVGVTSGGSVRRAVLRFDVAAALPAGATLVAAELELTLSKVPTTLAKPIQLQRLTQAFGEGASDAANEEGGGAFAAPGDATWTHTFFPSSFWTNPGGDYSPLVSSTTDVFGLATYAFPSTPQLVADVQSFLDAPAGNFGWIVRGPESESKSAMRFDSRENPLPQNRPRLSLTFLPPGICPPAAGQQLVQLGNPANPLALLPVPGNGPEVGATWPAQLDHQNFAPTAVVDLLALAALPAQLPTEFGTLLLDLSSPLLWFSASPGASFAVPVPAQCSLVGRRLYAQGASLLPAGQLELCNALELWIGAP